MKTYNKIYHFFSFSETITLLEDQNIIMLKIFVVCMVTNIMVNFLIFTHGYTKLSKIEIMLPKYQLYNVTYLMKIT